MYLCMKTTVEIPDDLLIEAKKRAAELRLPMRVLIVKGLRKVLDSDIPGETKKTRKKLRWVTVKGGLPEGLDVADREAMHDWLLNEQ